MEQYSESFYFLLIYLFPCALAGGGNTNALGCGLIGSNFLIC
jgi:hypothetical protein